jgi:hypothetical protein
LTATAQLNQLRQAAAENYGGLGMKAAGMQGQDIMNAAEARAQGVMGAANAWQGALSGVGGAAMGYGAFNKMYPTGGGTTLGSYLSPGQISGAFGGPSSASTIGSDVSGMLPLVGG